VLQEGGLCCVEGSAGLECWPKWVLSFLLGPFPCPSGTGNKARALKHTDCRHLLVLVGPYVEEQPWSKNKKEDVGGSESS